MQTTFFFIWSSIRLRLMQWTVTMWASFTLMTVFLNFFNPLHLWPIAHEDYRAKITFSGRAVTGHPGGSLPVHFTWQAQRHSNSEEQLRKMSDPDGSSREPGERLKTMVCLPTKVQLINSWKQTLPELLFESNTDNATNKVNQSEA